MSGSRYDGSTVDGEITRSLIIGCSEWESEGCFFRSWETEHKDWESFSLGFFMFNVMSINRFQENVNVIDSR